MANRRPAAVLAALAVSAAATIGIATTDEGPPTVLVPATIPADCSRPVDADLNRFIATVPDGRRIRFPQGGCYAQAHRIELLDRRDLTVDGNGATFRTTASGCTTKKIDGNWVLIRGSNITLEDFTAVGSFDLPGPRSLTAESASPCYSEANPNVGVYGTDSVRIVDVAARNAWGDNVTLGPAQYPLAEPGPADVVDFPNDVHIVRMTAAKPSRHCWAPTSGVGLWIEDSSCTDAWYAGLDAETDDPTQPLRDHHYLRNTFDGFNIGGLLIPVPGIIGAAGNIEIRGNRFLTPPDVPCNQTVNVGAYPNIDDPPRSSYGFHDVVVADNLFRSYTRAVNLDRVKGGQVDGNRIDQLVPPGTITDFCGSDAGQIVVTNSVDVTVNAGPPPTTPPGPTPTPPPLPTTTTIPPATTTTRATSTTRPGRCLNLAPSGRICVID